MSGPLPKNPAIRQRTNKSATATSLPAEGQKRLRVPPLPKLMVRDEADPAVEREHEWHALTRAWWREVWRSPMAGEYLKIDTHGLYRLAVLVDDFWRAPSRELAAEIRLQQQCFGLSPIDRRRLQWEVEREPQAPRKNEPPAATAATAADPARPIDDPRRALRIVNG